MQKRITDDIKVALLGVGETNQQVKNLPLEYEDLGSIPETHMKRLGLAATCPPISTADQAEKGGPLGLSDQPA